MALATWEFEGAEEVRRPSLRLVEPVVPTYRVGRSVSARRAARRRMMVRRRRAALLAGVVISLVVLAWPGHAFGGETGWGASSDTTLTSPVSAGMVYVVQPGDTVGSIARLMDPSSPASAQRALVRELGSDVVVPGEHVLIP